ncbi:hypothetical protein NDU88_002897 [Pleurodeles waltl]|uniref:Uncharacterized protein n=1 Tax=Pleurodeles waltl TaxID=8319 RepID=A0AAV7W448_PLEWA|nr:hypothetical protein NDU88_002897 [Pleurodeles waltl]
MVVGSVLPLRQLSIRREGGVRRRPGLLPAPGAAVEPLSRRGLCLASKPVNYEAEQKVDGCKKRLECGDPLGADSAYTAWYQTLP